MSGIIYVLLLKDRSLNMIIRGENEHNDIDLDRFKTFRKQEFNTIYQTQDTLIKILNYIPCNDLEIVLDKLMKLNLSHFYKIINLIYNDRYLCGYIMKKYRSYQIDILEYPSNYTIENYNELFEDLLKLSRSRVIVRDLSYNNSVFNPYDITIIDADDYLLCEYEPTRENIFELSSLFKEIFINSIFMYHPYLIPKINEVNKIIDEVFSGATKPEGVQRKLSRYKYPIDFINDRLD